MKNDNTIETSTARRLTSLVQTAVEKARASQNSTDCFISKEDVAARLGKTVRTVEHWMQRGVIPYIKIGKGRRATVLFKWADIEAHLKSNFGVGMAESDDRFQR